MFGEGPVIQAKQFHQQTCLEKSSLNQIPKFQKDLMHQKHHKDLSKDKIFELIPLVQYVLVW